MQIVIIVRLKIPFKKGHVYEIWRLSPYLACWKILASICLKRQYVLGWVQPTRWRELNGLHLGNNLHHYEVRKGSHQWPTQRPCKLRTKRRPEDHIRRQEGLPDSDIVVFEYLPWSDGAAKYWKIKFVYHRGTSAKGHSGEIREFSNTSYFTWNWLYPRLYYFWHMYHIVFLNVSQWQFLRLLFRQNWFHVKLGKYLNFHTVIAKLRWRVDATKEVANDWNHSSFCYYCCFNKVHFGDIKLI